jgi:phospholipid/cholesterol/gamma-HCH transport system ATP-binding protein
VDEEIVKLRDIEGVSSILVTHQLRDAFFVACHRATRHDARVQIESADQQKSEEAEFIMLKDGGIIFEGPAGELRRSSEPYLQRFLS